MNKIELLDFIKSLGIEYGIKGDTKIIEKLEKCHQNYDKDIDVPENTIINGIKCVHASIYKYFINALDNSDVVIETIYDDLYSTLKSSLTHNGNILYEKSTNKVSVDLFEKIIKEIQSSNCVLKIRNFTSKYSNYYNDHYYGVNYSSFYQLNDCIVCIRNSEDNLITLLIDGEDIIYCNTSYTDEDKYPILYSTDESKIKSIYDNLEVSGYIDWKI